MSELVHEFLRKSGGISRNTCTVSSGWNVVSPCNSSCEIMALI